MVWGGRKVDIGGGGAHLQTKWESELFTGELEYCRSHECLGFWFEDEEKEEMEAGDGVEVGKLTDYMR